MKKNALILHGTGATPKDNWFPWMRDRLEALGYEVWLPQLPNSAAPNVHAYTKFLLANPHWQYGDKTLIVGHSSGAVEILALLQALPPGIAIDTAVFVAIHTEDLVAHPEWKMLAGMYLDPFDYPKIRASARQFVFVHSDDDPICPVSYARDTAEKVGGEVVVLHGKKHFSTFFDPSLTKVPELESIIERAVSDSA